MKAFPVFLAVLLAGRLPMIVTSLKTQAGIEIPHAAPQTRNTLALANVPLPDEFPLGADDLTPEWSGKDGAFYFWPKFVHHADETARKQLERYYGCVFRHYSTLNNRGTRVLDLCSSWTSHYPSKSELVGSVEDITVLGLNWPELIINPSRTKWPIVKDLNENTLLPFSDSSFDVITLSLSVDYLTSPLEAFKEMNRVLEPGGLAAMAFTNRCFPTKVIPRWLKPYDDASHCRIVYMYFYYSLKETGGWENIEIVDVSPEGFKGQQDPMLVVQATKKKL